MSSEEFLILCIVLGSLLFLFVCYLLAKEFYKVAQLKGYYEKKYLWLCFFLGIAGYLLVIALPKREATTSVCDDDLPAI